MICLEEDPSYVLLNCGHGLFCKKCAYLLVASTRT